MQRASDTLARAARGEVEVAPGPLPPPLAPPEPVPALPWDALVDGWAAERRPVEKTVYEWRRVARKLAKFVGHDDARRLTVDDLVRWKAAMIDTGLRPKTIRDAQLAPIRALLRWGVDNRHLAANPAERIVIDVRQRAGEGRRSFDDNEAAQILNAAAQASEPVRRWVPWICAYTGARVSEVCQLRREDVVQIDGIWCLKFDPVAGRLKNTSSERIVPLHPALIQSGILEFVMSVRSGPLFLELPPDKFGSRGGNGIKVLGNWVRSLGLQDPRLAPNHSWRHRMRTSARRYGMAIDIVNAITGHARKTVADRYGEYPVEALYRELQKIPHI